MKKSKKEGNEKLSASSYGDNRRGQGCDEKNDIKNKKIK